MQRRRDLASESPFSGEHVVTSAEPLDKHSRAEDKECSTTLSGGSANSDETKQPFAVERVAEQFQPKRQKRSDRVHIPDLMPVGFEHSVAGQASREANQVILTRLADLSREETDNNLHKGRTLREFLTSEIMFEKKRQVAIRAPPDVLLNWLRFRYGDKNTRERVVAEYGIDELYWNACDY